MMALMLPLSTEGKKRTIVRTDAVRRTIKDHKLYKKVWIHASRDIIISSDGVEETGSQRSPLQSQRTLIELWA